MSHDSHNNNGHQENKPVAFTAPLILGCVAVFIILLFVSLGNPCHGHEGCECKENCSKECMEACEKGDHSKHPEGVAGKEEGKEVGEENEANESKEGEEAEKTDSTKTEPEKEEAHK